MRFKLWDWILLLILILTGCTAEVITPTATTSAATGTSIVLRPTNNSTTMATPSAVVTPSMVGSPTPTTRPTNIPLPTATPTPTPSPTPTPQAILRQLTSGGCCVQPSFSPDSSKVLFVDKPSETVPPGVYGLDLTRFESSAETPPQLFYETIGFRSVDSVVNRGAAIRSG